MTDAQATDQLRQLVFGYRAAQAIHVAAELGIADLVADGARSADDLAAATGADPRTLYRLLRALAAIGVFREEDYGRFAHTPLSKGLRSDVPGSMHPWACLIGRPEYWDSWGNLLHSVRTGENAFRAVHGMSVWEYREKRPDESELFDRVMSAQTQRINQSLLDAYDFGRFRTVVDVAGGQGALLLALLEAHPQTRGILFDQPHVVANALTHDRLDVVGGNFFESVPDGGDAYVLKWIIHDWRDDESVAILRTVRAATRVAGTLILIERLIGEPNEDADTKFGDLNMLVMPDGQERTLDEYARLFERADFRLVGATPTASSMYVIEAAPA